MANYVARRLIWTVITIWAIVTVTYFVVFSIPANIARVLAGPHATPYTIAQIDRDLGLDKPLPVRYVDFLGQIATGNLGYDWIQRQPVSTLVLPAAPLTGELAVAAVLCELVIALPIGIISAVKPYTFLDNVGRVLSVGGISMPTYFIGSLLLLVFAFYLGWFPLGGVSLSGVVLPALSIGITGAAFYARILRSSMLEVTHLDFVRTARAKGVREWGVMMRHIFRNALIPVITYLGLDFGNLLGGLIITETIFDWNGLGLLLNEALQSIDGSLVMGLVIFSATAVVVCNLLVDIAYGFINPRITYS